MTDLRIEVPCRMIITGPSNSGKTTLLINLLEANQKCFNEKLGKIYWCGGILREEETKLIRKKLGNVTFIEGFPAEEIKNGTLVPKNENACLILDDLGHELEKSQELKYIFTMMSHHDKINVFLLLQVSLKFFIM